MMDTLASAHFVRPWSLWLAPMAVAVWWWWRSQTEPLRAWRRRIDAELLEALMVRGNRRRGRALLAVWMLLVLGIAGPTWRLEPNPFAESAPPLMILLKADADQSTDQLDRSRLKIVDLANLQEGVPMGLIGYAGSAHLVMPPTNDTQVVAEMAEQISPEVMPLSGDRLDLAVREAARVLSGAESGGSLLVLADSVTGDVATISTALRDAGSPPVQFLDLHEQSGPPSRELREVASSLGGVVEGWTPGDQDIQRIALRAQRRAFAGAEGRSERWQEAGYWLTPLIALIVALSFRRQEAHRPRGNA